MNGNFVLPEFFAEEHPPLKAEPRSKTNNSNAILILLYCLKLKNDPEMHKCILFILVYGNIIIIKCMKKKRKKPNCTRGNIVSQQVYNKIFSEFL